jgi:hypothetical protein
LAEGRLPRAHVRLDPHLGSAHAVRAAVAVGPRVLHRRSARARAPLARRRRVRLGAPRHVARGTAASQGARRRPHGEAHARRELAHGEADDPRARPSSAPAHPTTRRTGASGRRSARRCRRSTRRCRSTGTSPAC